MFEFDDIIKSANMYLAVKDKNLKYLYCNENVACGLGLDSPKQIIGKDDHELFKDNIAHIYRSGDAHVLKGGSLLNVHEIQPHTDKTIQILTTKNQLRNKSGVVLGVVISFIDITGLKLELPTDFLQYNFNRKLYEFRIGKQTDFFTRREYDVFKYTLLGLTAKQIAKRLALSSRTIEDHINKIKLKLQCSSKHQIAETAIRLGLVQQNMLDTINPSKELPSG
jgi:DNA-binding CsgD family transcriptional regulator